MTCRTLTAMIGCALLVTAAAFADEEAKPVDKDISADIEKIEKDLKDSGLGDAIVQSLIEQLKKVGLGDNVDLHASETVRGVATIVLPNGTTKKIDLSQMPAMPGFTMPAIPGDLPRERYIIGLELNADGGEKALQVVNAYPGMPAAKAGVKPGDVVIKVNGKETGEFEEIIDAAQKAGKAGKDVELTLSREGEEFTVKVTPRKEPGVAAQFTRPMTRAGLRIILSTTFIEGRIKKLEKMIEDLEKSEDRLKDTEIETLRKQLEAMKKSREESKNQQQPGVPRHDNATFFPYEAFGPGIIVCRVNPVANAQRIESIEKGMKQLRKDVEEIKGLLNDIKEGLKN